VIVIIIWCKSSKSR